MLEDFGPNAEYGDRRTELVFYATAEGLVNWKDLERGLDSCLFTDKECAKVQVQCSLIVP
jgi:hypothetical protein